MELQPDVFILSFEREDLLSTYDYSEGLEAISEEFDFKELVGSYSYGQWMERRITNSE